jgi:hypothetical protein
MVVSAFAMALAVLCSTHLNSQARSTPTDSFPMREGTFWVYRGVVRWYDMQLQKTVSSVRTSRCEVIRVFRHPSFIVALMGGFPWDFDWSEDKANASDWSVVLAADGEIHILDNEKLNRYQKRFENLTNDLQGILDDDDAFMKLPPKKGMKFCDHESRKRTDDRYCWVVASKNDVSLNGVKGIKAGKHTAFLLQYVTNPDDTELESVSNVGFISYRYHHHETVAETEMKLLEYHAAKDIQSMPRDKP